MRRRSPRPASLALDALTAKLAPKTCLAAVQGVWPRAVGETVAREANAVSERSGVVTVACRSAVWAHELDLMSLDVIGQLNSALEGEFVVVGLRCVVATANQSE